MNKKKIAVLLTALVAAGWIALARKQSNTIEVDWCKWTNSEDWKWNETNSIVIGITNPPPVMVISNITERVRERTNWLDNYPDFTTATNVQIWVKWKPSVAATTNGWIIRFTER